MKSIKTGSVAMIRCHLSLFLCLALAGCASYYHEYAAIYGNALNTGDMASIVKKENYADIRQKIAADITSLGYTNVIFENYQRGFIVVAKQDEAHPSAIILKYTSTTGDFRTHIDLVKASDDPLTNSLVRDDIQELSERIRNE